MRNTLAGLSNLVTVMTKVLTFYKQNEKFRDNKLKDKNRDDIDDVVGEGKSIKIKTVMRSMMLDWGSHPSYQHKCLLPSQILLLPFYLLTFFSPPLLSPHPFFQHPTKSSAVPSILIPFLVLYKFDKQTVDRASIIQPYEESPGMLESELGI